MNLKSLSPAWRRFQLLHSMQPIHQEEILLMLEGAEGMAKSKTDRFVAHALVFIVLIFICQGG